MSRLLKSIIRPLGWSKAYPDRSLLFAGVTCTPEQKKQLEWLMLIIALVDETNPPHAGLIASYFESWVLGLAYEITVPDEFHKYQLYISAETAEIIAQTNITENSAATQISDLFTKTYDPNSRIRSMLFSVGSTHAFRKTEE